MSASAIPPAAGPTDAVCLWCGCSMPAASTTGQNLCASCEPYVHGSRKGAAGRQFGAARDSWRLG